MDKNLEKYVKGLFLKHGKKIRYKVGQTVSSDIYITASVNYIYSGEARVIFKENQKLKTLTKIGPGQIIGAISLLKRVASENRRWVPPNGRGELYIRPIIFGSSARLGVAPADEYMFVVFAVPVGPYFKGGMTPISLRVSQDHHRAAPGGSGGVKAIGNYAPGMMPSKKAKSEGYSEIIYLDAVDHQYVEEVGAANFFCVRDRVLYTPELTGTILPGITRLSIIELARSMGLEVREERVDIDFALECDEAFCAGTAAVISPIGSIEHGEQVVNYGNVGEITMDLYRRLTGIMDGSSEDPFGWTVEI